MFAALNQPVPPEAQRRRRTRRDAAAQAAAARRPQRGRHAGAGAGSSALRRLRRATAAHAAPTASRRRRRRRRRRPSGARRRRYRRRAGSAASAASARRRRRRIRRRRTTAAIARRACWNASRRMSPDEQKQFIARMKERGRTPARSRRPWRREADAKAPRRRRRAARRRRPRRRSTRCSRRCRPSRRAGRAWLFMDKQLKPVQPAPRHHRRHATPSCSAASCSRAWKSSPASSARHDARRCRPAAAAAIRCMPGGGRGGPAAAVGGRRTRPVTRCHAVISVKNLVKTYVVGEVEVQGAARREPRRPARRVPRGHRTVGLRQVDVHAHRRLPRSADVGPVLPRRPGRVAHVEGRSWPPCATRRSASCSRGSTCCRAPRRSTTSSCRCSTAAAR